MQIFNATILVQIGNFGIAYLIIRYVILKPAIHVIHQEDSIYQALVDDIAHKRATLNAIQHELTQQWAALPKSMMFQ